MTSERRLATILVADVVGYSKLVGDDEAGTLARLKALRSEVIDPAIAKHSGRLFKAVGDGFLIEFASAVQAVACASAIQQANTGANLQLRIGVHLGDVIVDGADLLGDGVNIAARIEGVAAAGGIALSRQVHDQVRDRLDLEFVDKGEITLKNIARPVHVFAVGGSGSANDPVVLTLPDKPSIAVLPFQNMSGDPEQEYFADGIVEDIITALSRFKSLFVIARNSSFTYKGRAVDIKQVGRELGVRYVLEGSVRKAAGRVRITGQLIEAESGTHVWADRFDGDLADIFELQDRVTVSVVGAMVPKLDLAEIERAKRKPVGSLDAYDVFLRGMGKLYELKPGTWEEANTLFRQAIELDPSFATPYGLSARCYSVRRTRGLVVDAPADEAEVKRLAARVAAIGHEDAIALAWAGHSLMFVCHELDKGGAMVEQAVDVNPNSPTVWQLKGSVSMYRGEHELAISELKRALRMSPVGPDAFHIEQTMAAALLFLGRFGECQQWCERVLSHLPTSTLAMQMSATAHVLAGDVDHGRRVMREILRLRPDMTIANQKDIHPFRRREDQARWVEGLRSAGLPEGVALPLALPDKPSIAVLPFQNMSGDPEQEYFADGIVEEIITALSRDRGLSVIARNSSFSYKGKAIDIRQVGRELLVRYVLEGSVRKAGSTVRITAQLIDAVTSSHIWADRFDGCLEDVFDLQDEIANKVASVISPTVETAEIERAVRKAGNLDAYDLYLRAKAAYAAMTPGALDEALRLALASLALDSSYARCHALVAAIHIQRLIVSMSLDPASDSLEAEQAAQRALSLDASDAWVLTIYASVLMFSNRRHSDALPLLEKALRFDPNLALAWTYRGMCNNTFGRWEEAAKDLENASRLNPRDPWMWAADHARAWGYLMRGQYDEAANCATAALQMRPGFRPSLMVAIAAHALAGRLDKAKEFMTAHAVLEPDARISSMRELYVRRTSPESFDKLAEGLRKAGIPE